MGIAIKLLSTEDFLNIFSFPSFVNKRYICSCSTTPCCWWCRANSVVMPREIVWWSQTRDLLHSPLTEYVMLSVRLGPYPGRYVSTYVILSEFSHHQPSSSSSNPNYSQLSPHDAGIQRVVVEPEPLTVDIAFA